MNVTLSELGKAPGIQGGFSGYNQLAAGQLHAQYGQLQRLQQLQQQWSTVQHTSQAVQPAPPPETRYNGFNQSWLDRRVNEIRVKL